MSLSGNLAEFSASDILQLLATQRKSGRLVLEQGSDRRVVQVLEGRIVSTRDPGGPGADPLLSFIEKTRALPEEQRSGLRALLGESRRDLEDLLVNGRYVDGETLAALLERQILEDLLDVADWHTGSYAFSTEPAWRHPVHIRLNIEATLMEAARRVDERQRFRGTFADPGCVVAVVDLPRPDEELSPEESEMFTLLDGYRTVAEVVAMAARTDYEGYEALQRMVDAGWAVVHASPVSTGSTASPTATRPHVVPAGAGGARVLRELAVAALVVAALGSLWFTARAVPRPTFRGEETAFAAQRVQDVRYALELHRREHGTYPQALAELVAAGWIERTQLDVAGRPLHYRIVSGRDDYELTLDR